MATTGPSFRFPQATLAYFQFVFAAITPILMLGSVLGRINFKAWIPFVALWSSIVYTVDAFCIWGGGFFAQHGAVDYSGGYVIHLSAGVSGFVAAAVIGPRLQRDREIDAPNNVAMVAVGAGLLWLGWNGFNGGDPYFAGASASAAVLNTNLCTAVAFLVWVGWDYLTGRKPGLISGVNGMIVGLVAITPAAGFVNGWGAIAIGVIASTIVYFALNYLSRCGPSATSTTRSAWSTPTASPAWRAACWSASSPTPHMIVYQGVGKTPSIAATGVIHGNWNLLKWQLFAGLFVIVWSAVGDVRPAQAGRTVHPVANVGREPRDRRHRGARSRGLSIRRAVARVSERDTGDRDGWRRTLDADTRLAVRRARLIRAGERRIRSPAHAVSSALAMADLGVETS